MKRQTKLLFHISWISTLYFIFLALQFYGYFKTEGVLLSVVREMITLPLIGFQIFLFIWSIVAMIKNRGDRKGNMLGTFFFSMINTAFFVYGFF